MRSLPDLKRDPFYRQLTGLVFPIMIQFFMLALVSATDAVMLGMVDQESLSSVSLAGQVQFVLNLFISGIATGTGIIAAQYWGKQDTGAIERVIPVALRANLICGALFTLTAFSAPRLLMLIFTDEPALVALGADYLRAVSLSYLLCAISQIYLVVLKNTGAAALSSRISSCTVLLNILLNAILIFGLLGFPALGVVGAAYATAISRAVELVWSAAATQKRRLVLVRWGWLGRRDRALAGDFWRYTRPVLAAALVWGIAFTLYSVIMGHMGTDAVTANSIVSIAKSLLSCLIRGLGGGAGIMIGNLLGAGQLERAREYGGRLTRLAILVGCLSGGTLMLLSPLIVRGIGYGETVSRYLQGMLLFCGVNMAFQAVNHVVLDGIFCAGGDSRFDMVGNIGAMWCFSVPLGFLAAFWLKLPVLAVFCIVNMDEIVKIPAVYLHYKKYIWVRNITRQEDEAGQTAQG